MRFPGLEEAGPRPADRLGLHQPQGNPRRGGRPQSLFDPRTIRAESCWSAGSSKQLKSANHSITTLDVTRDHLALQISLPCRADGISEQREYYFGPKGTGVSPLFRSSTVCCSASGATGTSRRCGCGRATCSTKG